MDFDINEIVGRVAEATVTSPEQVRGAGLGLAVLVVFCYVLKPAARAAARLTRRAAGVVAARRARGPVTTEVGRRVVGVLADRDPAAVARWARTDAAGNTYAASVPVGAKKDGRQNYTKFSVCLAGGLGDVRAVAVTIEGVDVRLLTADDQAAIRAAGHALFLVLTERDTLAHLPAAADTKVGCADDCCPLCPAADKPADPKKTPADQVREFFAALNVAGLVTEAAAQVWVDHRPGFRAGVGDGLTVFRTPTGLSAYHGGTLVRQCEFGG